MSTRPSSRPGVCAFLGRSSLHSHCLRRVVKFGLIGPSLPVYQSFQVIRDFIDAIRVESIYVVGQVHQGRQRHAGQRLRETRDLAGVAGLGRGADSKPAVLPISGSDEQMFGVE
jgi:hypothetical protein